MMIRFYCASCGQPLRAPDEQIGEMLTCSCGATTEVPTDNEPAREKISALAGHLASPRRKMMVGAAAALVAIATTTALLRHRTHSASGQTAIAPDAIASQTAPPATASQYPPPAEPVAAAPGIHATAFTFEHAQELFNQQKYAEAIACLDGLEKTADGAPLMEWNSLIDPNGDVFPGTRCAYLHEHDYEHGGGARGRLDYTRNGPRARGKMLLKCVQLSSGQANWSAVIPVGDIFVDPQSDDVLILNYETVVRLRAADGRELYTRSLPEQNPITRKRIPGIRVGGRYIVPNALIYLNHPADKDILVYDADSQSLSTIPLEEAVGQSRRLFFNASDRQTPTNVTHVINGSLSGSTWSYQHQGYSPSSPQVIDGDLIAMLGTEYTPSELVRLDGSSGQVKWKVAMPRGAGVGLDVADHTIVALGGGGGLFIVDTETGQLLNTAAAPALISLPPRIAGRHVLLRGRNEVYCLRLDALAHRVPHQPAELALLRARCQAAMGNEQEGLKTITTALGAEPTYADGWKFKAEIARKLRATELATGAAIKLLDLTGQQESEELRQSFGLVRHIPTAPITAAPILAGGVVYFGGRDGAITEIDPHTLEVRSDRQLPSAVFALLPQDQQLQARCDDRTLRVILPLSGPVEGGVEPERKLSNDTLAGTDRRDWYTLMPALDGPVIEYNRRYYRPIYKGGLKVTDGKHYRLLPTALEGVESWEIALLPGGPIGLSDAGLFKLNSLLVPVEKVADFGTDGHYHPQCNIASDGKTLAVARPIHGSSAWTLEIRSLDGRQVLKSVPIAAGQHESHRLLPLNGGYVFCGDELAWVSAGSARDWRFAPRELPIGEEQQVLGKEPTPFHLSAARPLNSRRFTPCVLAEGHLFVASADGGIFIFDDPRISGDAGVAAAE